MRKILPLELQRVFLKTTILELPRHVTITPQRKLGSQRFWYRSSHNEMRYVQVVIMQFRIFAPFGPFSWSVSHFGLESPLFLS